MRSTVGVVGILVVTVACGPSRPDAERQEQEPSQAQTRETAARDTVVPHQSQTHGALQVMSVVSNPVYWFDVLQAGKRAYEGNPRLLNNTLELLPGDYVVDVNRTQRTVTIEAGRKVVLWTGDLLVQGEPTGAYWYPMEGTERRVTSNPPLLNRSLPLFPGTYTPFVHTSVTTRDSSLGDAQVVAGRTTTLTF